MIIKRYILLAFTLIAVLPFCFGNAGCESDADMASRNLSIAAENFEIVRRVVFYNGITDQYILQVEGLCSVEFYSNKFTVTCKTGPNKFKKHYLGRADNVFPFVEQMESAKVSTYHYRVIFKPQSILPDIDYKADGEQLVDAVLPDNNDE
jgi:hypothetical protein